VVAGDAQVHELFFVEHAVIDAPAISVHLTRDFLIQAPAAVQ
jgi:hypothetical protein